MIAGLIVLDNRICREQHYHKATGAWLPHLRRAHKPCLLTSLLPNIQAETAICANRPQGSRLVMRRDRDES